jgi:hypothetical protein
MEQGNWPVIIRRRLWYLIFENRNNNSQFPTIRKNTTVQDNIEKPCKGMRNKLKHTIGDFILSILFRRVNVHQ